ncbi:MAG: hypothetical protein WC785_05295 [Tatlockia sp.]|jgi:hypothetical protein
MVTNSAIGAQNVTPPSSSWLVTNQADWGRIILMLMLSNQDF